MSEIEQKTKELRKRLRSNVITKERLERTIISLGLYGRISGVIGPYIIANVNGKMIIRLRPVDFKKSFSAAAIAGRRNMAAANKFAIFLKSIEPLYELWRRAKVPGCNAFTWLIKYNKKHLFNDCPSARNSITPERYTICLSNIISTDKKGIIRISDDYTPGKGEKMVIILSADDRNKNFECVELYCGEVIAGQTIKLTLPQKQLCSRYSKFLIYSAVIREKGKKVEWSNTIVHEAEFRFEPYEEMEWLGYGVVEGRSQRTDVRSQRTEIRGRKGRVERMIHSPP